MLLLLLYGMLMPAKPTTDLWLNQPTLQRLR
jgi:hypothetical protein